MPDQRDEHQECRTLVYQLNQWKADHEGAHAAILHLISELDKEQKIRRSQWFSVWVSIALVAAGGLTGLGALRQMVMGHDARIAEGLAVHPILVSQIAQAEQNIARLQENQREGSKQIEFVFKRLDRIEGKIDTLLTQRTSTKDIFNRR